MTDWWRRFLFGNAYVELLEARAAMKTLAQCRDYWSWYGSSGRECELPRGHAGCHESGGIRWSSKERW